MFFGGKGFCGRSMLGCGACLVEEMHAVCAIEQATFNFPLSAPKDLRKFDLNSPKPSKMAPVLIYFGSPGRGEVARLLFTLGKLEFEVQFWGALATATSSSNSSRKSHNTSFSHSSSAGQAAAV